MDVGVKKKIERNLIKWAERLAITDSFWFRQKYNLSPKSTEFLHMEPWQFRLEHEASLIASGNKKKECPYCNCETYRNYCPKCLIALTGDKTLDDVRARVASGESVNLDKELRR